jgi:hypothetical protein
MKHRYPQLLVAGACFVCAAALCIPAVVAGEPGAPAGGATDAKLAFTAAGKEYTFNTGALRGTLREGGKSKGLLPVLYGDVGIAGSLGIMSPYRLLTADARFGTAAWDWASEARLLPDGAVEVRWSPDAQHPLEMTAVYRWSAPNVLDFTATVKPQQDLRKFELFTASYFDGFPASLVYVQENPQAGGKPAFLEAVKATAVWQAFPRDDEAARIITDGRWKFPPNPVEWKIMPRLAAPLAVRRDAKSGLAAVLMASPEDCFAVLTPFGEEGHRSVYFSLFGRDLKAGETAAARARLVIGRDISDEQAIALYRAYVKKEAPAAP